MDITNAAYYGTTGRLDIAEAVDGTGGDNYTAGVTSCALVPNTPTAQVTDIGGGVQGFVGAPQWQVQVTYSQDWLNADSLSFKSIEDAGEKRTFTYWPEDGGPGLRVRATMMPGQAGGQAASHQTATINLPVDGQPEFIPVTP
jgi:hypothetical protein